MTPLANPLDWRRQVEDRPLLSVGAAFIGGVILGGVTSEMMTGRLPATSTTLLEASTTPGNAEPTGAWRAQ